MNIKEMIVVEGRDDTANIQRAVVADTIETGGSAINEEVLKRIELAQQRRGVIIFTDPDYPGNRIRTIISKAVPGCKHAFLPREKALSKKGKIGVEHATPEAIRQALYDVRTELINTEKLETTMAWFQLSKYGLVGQPSSQQLRAKLGDRLGIGYCNAKQFEKRLQAFRITQDEFEKKYEEVKQEISDHEEE
ncbi:ribonuclease M5 [Bacillus horti]|uniref:Ribonuclease M5 n=1 Tax=Caldalkalibacillus horti TaxID=77523 RepID=A0ABT9W2U7_9BACI|nr:ribonuclease M5 [Bacillus horti]MDQ0167568.1 ribonuclease M5 [Bacillus horti]